VISLGIGDVTQPLAPAVIEAMHQAVDELASAETFRGYGPEHGHDFLRRAIVEHDYRDRGIEIDEEEVFVSDGAKSDTANFQELFAKECRVAVCDPVYPVYVDSNVIAGRTGTLNEDGRWSHVTYLPCTAENNFTPELPKESVDLIYLCYPNNPTGTVLPKEELKKWVDFAISTGAILLYDSAYEAYIRDESIPHSIYEIPNARRCAIEFRSYSKTAGFTGVRCGYTIVPKELSQLNHLWERRQSTKFNGASYISQRAASAIYTEAGRKQVKETIDRYMENALLLRTELSNLGIRVYGGEHAPYLWVQCPTGQSSWECFEQLLHRCALVSTPGSGFGPSGEGFIRLTAFGRLDDTKEAIERIKKNF